MGLESPATLRTGRTRTPGKALLESDHLLFRGEGMRLRIPLASISAMEAKNGALQLTHAEGTSVIDLGDKASVWLEKMRNPRSLLDKLGVKAGMRVAVLGIDDAEFLALLATRIEAPLRRVPKSGVDLLFFGAESVTLLDKLAGFRTSLVPDGAIWVVHRKGKSATLKDVDVFAAAKRAGLVDTKVAAFSMTHTAEKLVIPKALR